ncbi:MAG: GNAT family N-acetyltransferase, partial [Acidimicrobiia bacterium]
RSRDRERQLGTAYGFGIFVGTRFCGEINLSGVQRGPFQSGSIGYWIDEDCAGHGYVPEAVVLLCRFGFEDLGLHRLEVAIIPRNKPSRRVMEKLGIREEGLAVGFLEIDGTWEDHVRFAITDDDWWARRSALVEDWLT